MFTFVDVNNIHNHLKTGVCKTFFKGIYLFNKDTFIKVIKSDSKDI